MSGLSRSSSASRFPLVQDRIKGAMLLATVILGRALRDIIVPAGSQVGRGVYAGALVGVILYLLSRPGITPARALLWAVLGGFATTVIVAF